MGKHELEFGEEKETFLKKIKRKINQIFDDDESKELTFLGKIFMLGIYGMFLSVGGIIITSLISTICKVVFGIIGLALGAGILTAAGVVFWLLFVLSFLIIAFLTVVEAIVIIENEDRDDSILCIKKDR